MLNEPLQHHISPNTSSATTATTTATRATTATAATTASRQPTAHSPQAQQHWRGPGGIEPETFWIWVGLGGFGGHLTL